MPPRLLLLLRTSRQGGTPWEQPWEERKKVLSGPRGALLRALRPHSCTAAAGGATCAGNFVLIYELLDEVLDFGYPQVGPTHTAANCSAVALGWGLAWPLPCPAC